MAGTTGMGIDPNMLAMILGGAGSAISPAGSFGDKMGQFAVGMAGYKMKEAKDQQRTDNFAKLLQKALDGGGNISFNSQGFNLKAPNTVLKTDMEDLFSDGLAGPKQLTSAGLGMTKVGGGASMPSIEDDPMAKTMLPFSSGPQEDFLSSADLTGLTPEDLSSALQFKQKAETRDWDQLKDMVNMKYTIGLMNHMEKEDELAYIKALTKDDRTELQKNFDAVNDALVAAGQSPKRFDQFLESYQSESIRQYNKAKSEGYEGNFKSYLTDIKKAGASVVNLGDETKKVIARKTGENIAELRSNNYMLNLEKEARKQLTDSADAVLGGSGESSDLSLDEQVKFKTLELFTENVENMYGAENITVKHDKKSQKVFWYKDGNELIRSYKYGTSK